MLLNYISKFKDISFSKLIISAANIKKQRNAGEIEQKIN